MSPVKILVVDDEPDLELLVRQKFRRLIREKELEFAFARNGAEALERLREDPQTDLVLTDINMPVMDGLALLSRITELDSTIKTVVISAYSDMGNIRTAMNRGAYDFLTKPIDFEDLTTTINKTAQHAQMLKQALREREQLSAIQQELNVATRIQQSILPSEFPPFPGVKEFDLYAEMIPAREVGGDFYDFFLLDQDRLGLAIGDVSDKGVPAAIFMAVTRTLLKSIALAGPRPSDCLRQLNQFLAAENASCMFVTICYGIFNIRSGEFEYCNAGHNPPVLVAPSGDTSQLTAAGGIAAGIMEDAAYQSATIRLKPGDSLFFYTDGITEAINGDNGFFSVERLQSCLQRAGDASPREMIETVADAVRDFAGEAPQSDDLTMLAIKRLIDAAEPEQSKRSNPMPEPLTITINNDLSKIEPVSKVIADFISQHGLPAKIAFDLNLALDELLTNTILYGYEDERKDHVIRIRVSIVEDVIELTLEDDGRPFNPLEAPPPDLGAALTDRPAGGLGIHLVRSLTDQIEYQRSEGKNLLTIKKLARLRDESPGAPNQ